MNFFSKNLFTNIEGEIKNKIIYLGNNTIALNNICSVSMSQKKKRIPTIDDGHDGYLSDIIGIIIGLGVMIAIFCFLYSLLEYILGFFGINGLISDHAQQQLLFGAIGYILFAVVYTFFFIVYDYFSTRPKLVWRLRLNTLDGKNYSIESMDPEILKLKEVIEEKIENESDNRRISFVFTITRFHLNIT